MTKKEVIPLIKDSYLAVVKNSIGSRMWRVFFAEVKSKKKNISKRGKLSCAFFVSTILVMFSLIKKGHMTVKSTIKDMRTSGWFEIKKPRIGSILVWEATNFGGGDICRHIGFYVGNNKAISNSSISRQPVIHDYKFGKNNRKIEHIFWHKILNN